MKIKNQKLKIKNGGFTLVEILVVIGIILILIGLSIVGYSAIRKATRDHVRRSDLVNISSALEIYRTDCGEYPAVIKFGSPLNGGLPACSGNVYIPLVPKDPYATIGTRSYYYARLTTNTYELCASLEQGGNATCGGSCTAVCNFKVVNP